MTKITQERRLELETIRAEKKHAEVEGVAWEHARRGGNRPVPRVVPIGHGKAISVYPDDATLATMNEEGWTKVKVGFRRNDDGEFAELFLRKADDGTGINIRHHDQQRTNIPITVRHHGKAVAKPNAGACSVRRVEDMFVFGLLDQISII